MYWQQVCQSSQVGANACTLTRHSCHSEKQSAHPSYFSEQSEQEKIRVRAAQFTLPRVKVTTQVTGQRRVTLTGVQLVRHERTE